MKIQEVVERAVLTFVETVLAVVVAAGTDWVNVSLWKGAAVAGGASLFSFVLNLIRSKKSV